LQNGHLVAFAWVMSASVIKIMAAMEARIFRRFVKLLIFNPLNLGLQ
jgi:hypothetical protein